MMKRRWWIAVTIATVVGAFALVGLVFDDGSDDWHGGTRPGGTAPPRRSAADDEAARAAREQFETVFARCGEVHRAKRIDQQPVGGGRSSGGMIIVHPVTVLWEYRGLTFDPRPEVLTQADGFNKTTWRGTVVVSYAATRLPQAPDPLWREGPSLALPMLKRAGVWDPSAPLIELRKKGWSAGC